MIRSFYGLTQNPFDRRELELFWGRVGLPPQQPRQHHHEHGQHHDHHLGPRRQRGGKPAHG